MRIRHRPWAMPELLKSEFYIADPALRRGAWRDCFAVPQAPLHLELGCGKGGFITTMAVQYPDVNFIAVDIKDDMLGLTKRLTEQRFAEAGREVDNLRLVLTDVQYISRVFAPEDAIDRLYLNFSNPWPKPKHKKRRLTHPRQLVQYREFLRPDAEVWFKTDDTPFFEESLEYILDNGGEVRFCTDDLAASGFTESVPTEHEAMFTEMGKKIHFVRFVFGQSAELPQERLTFGEK